MRAYRPGSTARTAFSIARVLLIFLLLTASATLAWLLSTHIQPAQAAPVFLETPIPGSEPWGLTEDHLGNLWLAVPQCDPSIYSTPVCPAIVRGSLLEYAASGFANGVQPLHSYQLPAGYSSPFFATTDARNDIWFTEPVTNALGELDTSGQWHQWSLPTPATSPFDLLFDQYGHLWFTEPGISAIGEFNPATSQFNSFATPTTHGDPYGLAGPDPTTGSLWFTENNNAVHRIGRIIPDAQGGTDSPVLEYLAPATNNNTPHLITFDHSGHIWWTEGWAGKLGELVIQQAVSGTSRGISEYQVPAPACPPGNGCGVHISGISTDSYGTVWFDDSLSSRIGSYTPGSGFHMYTIAGSLISGVHPHDGLFVDSTNNLWVSEEFGNQLLKVVQQQPAPTPTPIPIPQIHDSLHFPPRSSHP